MHFANFVNRRRNMVHNKLKALIASNNMKQKDLAEYLEVDNSTISLKINCKRDFTITEIEKIKKFFNKSYEEIFFNEEIRDMKTA
jgi:DNA-binding XRE family transcriptional regulator